MTIRTPLLAASILFSATTTIAPAAPPASQPAVVEIEPSIEDPNLNSGRILVGSTSFHLKFYPGAGTPTSAEVQDVMSRLRWRAGTDPDAVLNCDAAYYPVGDNASLGVDIFAPQGQLARGVMLDPARASARLAAGLRQILQPLDPTITTEQRVAEIRDTAEKLAHTRAMKQALLTLNSARPSPEDSLKDRVQGLQKDMQRLQMTLETKKARQAALEQGLQEQRARLDRARDTDEISDQLKKIIEIREKDVKVTETQVGQGLKSQSELAEAQAKLAEARVRLAERNAAIAKAGAGLIADRLADEMAMLSIDLTDIRLQLNQVQDELHRLDPAVATTQSLDRVLDQRDIPTSSPMSLPPLYQELTAQEHALIKRKLRLQIQEITENLPKPGAKKVEGGF